jgi:hypothetical protein
VRRGTADVALAAGLWEEAMAEAPDNTVVWGRVGPMTTGTLPELTWQPTIPEPPADGKWYARECPVGATVGAWRPTIDEAPLTAGIQYVRSEGGWVPIVASPLLEFQWKGQFALAAGQGQVDINIPDTALPQTPFIWDMFSAAGLQFHNYGVVTPGTGSGYWNVLLQGDWNDGQGNVYHQMGTLNLGSLFDLGAAYCKGGMSVTDNRTFQAFQRYVPGSGGINIRLTLHASSNQVTAGTIGVLLHGGILAFV